MEPRARQSALPAFLEGLRQEVYSALCSRTRDLISALQARQIENARQIAARLYEDLQLCDSDRPSYFLGQVVTLLDYEDVFVHCDEVSVWLLALEGELDQIRRSHRALAPGWMLVSADDDSCPVPIRESVVTQMGAQLAPALQTAESIQ